MSDPNVTVHEMSRDELEAIERRVLAEHPYLDEFDPHCCGGMGCSMNAVRREHGEDAARAWQELSNARFLLGREQS